jgi:hypothetical protein
VVEGYRGFLEACPLMPMFPNRYMQSFYGLDYLRYGDEFIFDEEEDDDDGDEDDEDEEGEESYEEADEDDVYGSPDVD